MSRKADKNNTNETLPSYKEIAEFYFFLEMSVDCLRTVESYEIFKPIFVNKYVKKRLNDYFAKEGYYDEQNDGEVNSFHAFENFIYFNSEEYCDQLKERSDIVGKEINDEILKEYNKEGIPNPEKIKDLHCQGEKAYEEYRFSQSEYDVFTYILAENHEDNYFALLNDEKVYQSLFVKFEEKIKSTQITEWFQKFLWEKLEQIKEKLNVICETDNSLSGRLIGWYALIGKYIEKTEELILSLSISSDIKLLEPKAITLLLRSLFDHIEVDTKDDAFYNLLSRITGVEETAVSRYIKDDKVLSTDNAYAKIAITTIEILERLNDKQPLKGDKTKDKLISVIKMLIKSVEGLDIKSSLEKTKISNLIQKYSKKK